MGQKSNRYFRIKQICKFKTFQIWKNADEKDLYNYLKKVMFIYNTKLLLKFCVSKSAFATLFFHLQNYVWVI